MLQLCFQCPSICGVKACQRQLSGVNFSRVPRGFRGLGGFIYACFWACSSIDRRKSFRALLDDIRGSRGEETGCLVCTSYLVIHVLVCLSHVNDASRALDSIDHWIELVSDRRNLGMKTDLPYHYTNTASI